MSSEIDKMRDLVRQHDFEEENRRWVKIRAEEQAVFEATVRCDFCGVTTAGLRVRGGEDVNGKGRIVLLTHGFPMRSYEEGDEAEVKSKLVCHSCWPKALEIFK